MKSSQRKRHIFNTNSEEPFRISRSKIELFEDCPKCFYLDRKLGISRPSGPPFTLNSAIDTLLKKEFDSHRTARRPHPLMSAYGIDAVPFLHDKIDEWRENFKGVQFYHVPTNFLISGAVDDIWINHAGELHVVDYKATSTKGEITLDSDYRASYKRQMEIYQWLLRRNNLPVSSIGYFVYANGDKDKKAFDGRLEFNVQIITYKGNDDWVEDALHHIKECLIGDIPEASANCVYCEYRKQAAALERKKRRNE